MLKKVAAHIRRYNPYSMYAAKSELKGEVGSSYLTWLWWILDPVLFMLVYVFITVVVFKSLGKVSSGSCDHWSDSVEFL